MKAIVNINQRGLFYRNGRFIKALEPGAHRLLGAGCRVQVMNLDEEFRPEIGQVTWYADHPELEDALQLVEVGDDQAALHYRNNRFEGLLTGGTHAFWKAGGEHRFQLVGTSDPEITGIPRGILEKMRPSVQSVEVHSYQKGLLFYDGALVKILDEGAHWFWNNPISGVKVTMRAVDMRLQQLNIQGQEVLSLDKVAVRANFVCRYRITDCERVVTEIIDFQEQLHVAAQLILREYIGGHRLDELLENREQLSGFVLEGLKKREKEFFVEIVDAGLRDIILPGEIRDIMNTVLVAEKKAQANVITRREEVASTRSLLNTARLMEENSTLMRLKEMEYLERICDNVGAITVGGGGDLLKQLAQLLKGA